ncbi:PilW family protein [Microbacterium sp. YJN-G]|uniref:PilW family protein n=1 Tax=Microbacterium sp. YJN-G TaxID=2763257 RepID=UPI001878213D|nr:hypothetical protein [Microbacterium sp. YJN-G]
MTASAVHQTTGDAGVTLVELIIGMLIGTVVLGVSVLIFANSLQTQATVTSVTQATNEGQIVASTIERAVRNADFIDVSADQRTLQVQTSLGGALTCQGFHLDGDTIRMTLRSTPLGDPALWPAWQDGVAAHGSDPFVARAGRGVVYAFDMTTDATPVLFTGEASLRSISTGQARTCW